jgi:hypothetical protein
LDLLLRLSDHAAMKYVVDKIQADYHMWGLEGAEIIEDTRQIAIFPYLEPLLFLDEPSTVTTRLENTPEPRKSIFAAELIIGVLARSQMVSEEVRKWALSGRLGTEEQREVDRDVIRRWYQQNKTHILRGDYTAIKPGDAFVPSDPIVIVDSDPDPPAKGDGASEMGAKSQGESPMITGEQASALDAPTAKVSKSLWIAIPAGVVLACMISILFWMKRRRED